MKKKGRPQEVQTAGLFESYIKDRMNSNLSKLRELGKENKFIKLASVLKEGRKRFKGIDEFDRKTEPIRRLLLQGDGRKVIYHIKKKDYLSTLAPIANMKKGDKMSLHIASLMETHVNRMVKTELQELTDYHKAGDFYQAASLIKSLDKGCKGVPVFDETVKPIRKDLETRSGRTLISIGSHYYRLSSKYAKTNSSADRKRLIAFGKRNADTYYGKLASGVK